jgi:hypothetical protein
LPTDLGECVRVDYWQSESRGIFRRQCVPQAVALWNLDGDVPVLSYAQGGSTGYGFPIDLGGFDIDAQEDCELGNATETLRTWSYTFTLAGSSVNVPSQTSGLLMTSTGDYEARNLAAQSWSSADVSHGSSFYWWEVHPAL